MFLLVVVILAWTIPLADRILAAAPQRGKIPVPHISSDTAGSCPAARHCTAAYSSSHQSFYLETGNFPLLNDYNSSQR